MMPPGMEPCQCNGMPAGRVDLVASIVPELHDMPARLVMLGTGEPGLEDSFRLAARHFTRNVRTQIAFDVPLSHKIIAGCDALLVPSRFEPCHA